MLRLLLLLEAILVVVGGFPLYAHSFLSHKMETHALPCGEELEREEEKVTENLSVLGENRILYEDLPGCL